MKTNLLRIILVLMVWSNFNTSQAQQLNHELGVMIGPVGFKGDYGERGDAETNFGNTGFGIGLSHYLNFAYSSRYNRYFNQHFKVRTQLSFHKTNLEHYGVYVNSAGENSDLLRAMTGSTSVFEIGTGLEWYWKDIREFETSANQITPYAGLGIGVAFANPNNETNLEGRLGSIDNTWPTFLWDQGEEPRISSTNFTTGALNFQLGAKIKLDEMSELNLEGRWHVYFDDMVEGLNPSSGNKYNDWIFWVGIGYIQYL